MDKQLTLYTFGYLATSAERTFAELIQIRTPIVDIRYKPTSRHYQYNLEMLERRDGILYYWIEDLGNEHYKQALTGRHNEPRIKLHNAPWGLLQLKAILDTHSRAALLCACVSPTTCHRRMVAELAAQQLGCRVIHLGARGANTSPVMQAALFDDKQLLQDGLHPDQHAIEQELFQHYSYERTQR